VAVIPVDEVRREVHDRPLGLYVHVPFCARRCGYCAFTTYALGDDGDLDVQDRYVRAALGELEVADQVLGPRRPPLSTVYLGGGTPTMLTAPQVRRLLDGVRDRFELAEGVEVSIEANPDGLRPGQLEQMRDAGVTRVSYGMQSLSSRVLRTLDRTHDPERALAAVAEAHHAGFEHVSLDLIYGTPGETAGDWERTLRAVVDTRVDHVSA
jgi:oxygen-independent coproporphyrinogen-3 oxidase